MKTLNVTKLQRLILVIYCVSVAYCCLWVPWHLVQGTDYARAGYGWLWAGPSNPEFPSYFTTPDLPVIARRLLAATAIAGAAYVGARS